MEEQLKVFIAPGGNRTHAGLRMLQPLNYKIRRRCLAVMIPVFKMQNFTLTTELTN